MPHLLEAETILAAYRAVERELHTVKANITDPKALYTEVRALHAEASRLRNEYQFLTERARRGHQSVPPPFPATAES